jgi:hypothetical protein
VAAGQVSAFSAGALFLFWYLRSGRSRLSLAIRATPLQRGLLADILKVGALACISPLQTVATVLILTRLVAQFGATALAGYGIGARLEFAYRSALPPARVVRWWHAIGATWRAPSASPGSRRCWPPPRWACWARSWPSHQACGWTCSRSTPPYKHRPGSTSAGPGRSMACSGWA